MTAASHLSPNLPNCRRYRPREGVVRQAHLHSETAQYQLSWGLQTFVGPHMRVHDPAGEYGVELDTFFRTHRPVTGRDHCYVKVATVHAWCVTEAVTVETYVSGHLEMTAIVPPGAYIVENPGGEQFSMSAEEFFNRYELD